MTPMLSRRRAALATLLEEWSSPGVSSIHSQLRGIKEPWLAVLNPRGMFVWAPSAHTHPAAGARRGDVPEALSLEE